jgi:hypothetical protein
MSCYIHLRVPDTLVGHFWPDTSSPMRFAPARHIVPEKQDAWFETTGMFLSVFADYFDHAPFDVALSMNVSPRDRIFSLAIGYVTEKIRDHLVLQHEKPSAGYVTFFFNARRSVSSLRGATVQSRAAHNAGFLQHALTGVQNFCAETGVTDEMSVAATGAGVYTWASYGATPLNYETFIPSLVAQWNRIRSFFPENDLAPELGDWVTALQSRPNNQNFRSIFRKATHDPHIRDGLKALMLGDGYFLTDSHHRYQAHTEAGYPYGDPLNGNYRFLPQDSHFQNFFADRINALQRKPT